MAGKRRGPKRRPRGPFASSLPRIRDWLVDDYLRDTDQLEGLTADDLRDTLDRLGIGGNERAWLLSGLDPGQRPQAAELQRFEAAALASAEAELWWVTKRMAIKAAEAAETIPEFTLAAVRPSRHGVLWWEGGTGLVVPGRIVPGPGMSAEEVEASGCAWVSTDAGEMLLTPLMLDPDGEVGVARSAIGHTTLSETRTVGFSRRLWPMLAATWLLGLTPTVGRTHNVRYDRRDPGRPFARPSLPGAITVVTLRKAEMGRPEVNGRPRSGLDHQYIVRGHWRQQACGPRRAWRKPVYITPYIKGPEGTELVTKPVVHVLRR